MRKSPTGIATQTSPISLDFGTPMRIRMPTVYVVLGLTGYVIPEVLYTLKLMNVGGYSLTCLQVFVFDDRP